MKSRAKRKKPVDLLVCVPEGQQQHWSAFYADCYTAVWSDGTIGLSEHQRKPSKKDSLEIRRNIIAAIGKLHDYAGKLVVAYQLLKP